jgi:hypothetical protein
MAADQKHLNAKASITDIAAKVENDEQESVRKHAQAHGMSNKTVHLHKDLQLSKKLASCVTPKLLDEEMKKKQIRTCKVLKQ